MDSSIAYLATFDGGQDIYILDLKSKESKKVTNFRDRPMISHLTYSPSSHSLFFDITSHHFRDIYEYGIEDGSLNKKQDHNLYDERNMASNNAGLQVFSQDKSGIYN